MDLGIKTFMDLLEAAAYFAHVVAAGAVFVAAVTYALNRKQLNFDVITSCTARWQEIMPDLERALKEKGHSKGEVAERYVDLCNEELFYFVEGYLPQEVVREWLTGMVLYLPHYDYESRNEDRPEAFDGMVSSQLFEGYPRVKDVFHLDRVYDPGEERQREALVREIEGRLEGVSRRAWMRRLLRHIQGTFLVRHRG